jgi:hypothetical protein
MVFTKMLILEKCKEVGELKDIPQARLVAIINHIFTLEDVLPAEVDWDSAEVPRCAPGEEFDPTCGYDSFSTLAVIYLEENPPALNP